MNDAAATHLHDMRFPNESPGYRAARDALLLAEVDLRRQTERVAEMRRDLPAGGAVPEDYVFDAFTTDGAVETVAMPALFGDRDTLIVYSFMLGPEMEVACPSCTSILDSLDGASDHVNQRAAFVVVARSPIERIMAYARTRGWRKLRLLSSAGNSYNRDYGGETPAGKQLPSLNVFTRGEDGAIRHFYNTELLFAPSDPGQHPRHVDIVWPVWGLLDFTPEGRAPDWSPRRNY